MVYKHAQILNVVDSAIKLSSDADLSRKLSYYGAVWALIETVEEEARATNKLAGIEGYLSEAKKHLPIVFGFVEADDEEKERSEEYLLSALGGIRMGM